MNLTQLTYFQAVCRHGSITSAVEELKISQPSVSSAIRALEEEFGVVLFERQHRGMVPTQEGQLLLSLVDSLLEHSRQVERDMHDAGRRRRALRIGVTPLVGSAVMPQLYAYFFKNHPDIGFHIREGAQGELLAQLAGDQADVVIVPHIRPVEAPFKAIPILQLKMACCLPPDHPLARAEKLRVEDVKDEPVILFRETSVQSRAVAERFTELGLEPNVLFYTDQIATLERFVSRDLAVGFLYNEFVGYARNMVGVPLDPPITAQVSVLRKASGRMFEELGEFLRFCRRFRFE